MIMCDKELLVAYLYDEVSDAERARAETHLRACAACREELAVLRGLRTDLASWAPPQPELGFRVVHGREPAAPATWRSRFTPAFGLAAAAVLVLAASSAVANLQVHYGQDGLTIRTGWTRSTVPPAPSEPVVATAQPAAIDAAALRTIEQRLADLEQRSPQAATSRDARADSTAASRVSDAATLKRVDALIARSENREQTVLARQIQQVTLDFDRKRATDLGRVQQALTLIDNRAASDAVMHRQLADMVRAVAGQK
ncbi:MAG: anti-sigma factor family protein [Vicinamibacterales bacterium]